MDTSQKMLIDRIATMLVAITPGPWYHQTSSHRPDVWSVWGPDGDGIAEAVHGNLALGGYAEDNAYVIAHAPEWLLSLLGIIKEQETGIITLEAHLEVEQADGDSLGVRCEELEADCDRLRAELTRQHTEWCDDNLLLQSVCRENDLLRAVNKVATESSCLLCGAEPGCNIDCKMCAAVAAAAAYQM